MMRKLFLLIIIFSILGFFGNKIFQNNYQNSSCFSKNEAGFTSGAALSSAGDKTSLDIRLSLDKAPRPLNFDAFIFVNGQLQHLESKIPVGCNQPAARSILLEISKDDAISVVFTRHIQDKIDDAVMLIRKGELTRIEPRLLSNVVSVSNAALLSLMSYSVVVSAKIPDRPAISAVTEIGSQINEFGGIIRPKSQTDSLAITIFNDTKNLVTYNLVCLHNSKPLLFMGKKAVVSFQLPAKKYVTVPMASRKTADGVLELVHCYSLYSNTFTNKKIIETSPIWPAFILRGELK